MSAFGCRFNRSTQHMRYSSLLGSRSPRARPTGDKQTIEGSPDADDKLYAPARYGCPSICNTDQGSQFTSSLWIDELKANGIKISMDGKGRWMDNVFIERLWRSLKYECVYLNAFDDLKDAKAKLNTWIEYYNHERPHSSLKDQTPNEFYEGIEPLSLAA